MGARENANDWQSTTLGACVVINDSTYVSSEDWPFVNYLDTANITDNRISSIHHLVAGVNDIPSRARRKVRHGDIVYSTVRPNQRHYGITRDPPDNFLASTGFAVLRGKERVAETSFVYRILTQRHVVDYLQGLAEQSVSAFPAFKAADIGSIPVRLPPMAVQRRIANVLGVLDDKIELNRRVVATLESSLKAMFQSWFGRSKNPVPEGWTVKSLDDVAHFQNGLALQKRRPADGEGRLPVLKIAQLRSEVLDGNEYASSSIPTSCIVEDGDVVFSWSGSLMVKVWCGGKAALNQHLFKVTSVDHRSWFIFGWLQQHMRTFQAIAADKATTMGHIRRQHLREAKCVVPGDEVLTAADGICVPLHEQLIHAKVESRNLAHLRDTLLPKLISGEIRIRNAEKIAEDAT